MTKKMLAAGKILGRKGIMNVYTDGVVHMQTLELTQTTSPVVDIPAMPEPVRFQSNSFTNEYPQERELVLDVPVFMKKRSYDMKRQKNKKEVVNRLTSFVHNIKQLAR